MFSFLTIYVCTTHFWGNRLNWASGGTFNESRVEIMLVWQWPFVQGHRNLLINTNIVDGFNESRVEVSKGAKIRNRYNQVPHLTQDTKLCWFDNEHLFKVTEIYYLTLILYMVSMRVEWKLCWFDNEDLFKVTEIYEFTFYTVYCKFGNFRENFIFANSVKTHICNVENSWQGRDIHETSHIREIKTLAKISEFTVWFSITLKQKVKNMDKYM